MRNKPLLIFLAPLSAIVLAYLVFWADERYRVYSAAEQALRQHYHVSVKIEKMDLSYPMPRVLIYLMTPFSHDHKWWVEYEEPTTHAARYIIIAMDRNGRFIRLSQW